MKPPATKPNARTQKAVRSQLQSSILSNRFALKRARRSLTRQQAAKLAKIPPKVIQQFETGDLGAITLRQFIALARVLGCRLVVLPRQAAEARRPTNQEILAHFDRLIASGKYRHFLKAQPDREHPEVRWDIVGDIERNRLFVVATNRKRKVRFGRISEDPGGWSIKGQIFGIDTETHAVAGKLCDELFAEHRAQLVGS